MGKHLENHAKIIHNQRTEGGIEPGTPLPFLRLGGGRGGGGGGGGLRPDKSGVRI